MSLNWNVEKCKDWKILVNYKASDKLKDTREWSITNALIWHSMTCGFNEITEKNYKEIYDWITENKTLEPKFKDITLSILSNKNTTNKQILFHDCFPISLGELSFTTQDTAVDYITCEVTFQYNMFEFIR